MNEETPDDRPTVRRWQRPEYETLISRALKLRCPRCGVGKLFQGFFRMHERCSGCGLKYERAPGYYLGSSYVNYGLTAVALLIGYVVLHYKLGFSNKDLAGPLAGFCVVFPLLAFRHARALWLAMDCRWDPGMMTDEED
ncbi:MAG TPA: DUF983 domain-containing protein [Caulifigura sp.]|jgi:uncharacterized protein (DUF983 family)|nr:DUF983 domain-containing protein [Caulifigura sp.]